MAGRNGSSNGERTVRMVQESFDRGEERFGVVTRIAGRPGIGPESLRRWVHRAEIDRGQRQGTTSEDARRMAGPEREIRGLRRADGVPRSASALLAAELDRPPRR